MKEKILASIVSGWPGTSSDLKWGNDRVWSVADKMFCCLCIEGAEQGKLSFKVDPERFLEFTDRPGFRPAPYLARAHWVTLDDSRSIDATELRALLRRAYELVRAKLTRKLQRELAD